MKKIITSLLKQKQFALKSEGISMRPLLQPDDLVYYRPVKFNKCFVNDLIIVQKNKQLFTHRVIYKNKKYLITKGDNNQISDGKIYPQQITGKLYQVKRDGEIIDPENIYLLQSTLYFQEITKIKKAFEKEHIDFVFLKGLPLHLYFEKTYPKRIYMDCDVLINKNHHEKAEKILIQFGYKKAKIYLSKIQQNLKDKDTECSYYKKINGFLVVFDLHLEVVFMMTQLGKLNALYPQRLIDQLTEEFLRTKKLVKIQEDKYPILSSENLIIYLALHFFHHNFRGAFRLEFLANVIKKIHNVGNGRDRSLQIIIEKYRLQNFIYPAFLLLNKYYQSPLSKDLLKTFQLSNFPTFQLLNLNNINIFDKETRLQDGVRRFLYLFFLSPNELIVRLMVFLNIQILYMIFWTFQNKIRNRILHVLKKILKS